MEEVGGSGTYTKDADEDEERQLKVVPVSIIRDLEEDELSGPVRIHGLQKKRQRSARAYRTEREWRKGH